MVQIINQNNNYNYNVVNDYKSDEEANKNLFDEDATKLKTTVNTAEDTKPTKDEPQMFNKPGIILVLNDKENGKRQFKRIWEHEEATNMEDDIYKSYASQMKVCKK